MRWELRDGFAHHDQPKVRRMAPLVLDEVTVQLVAALSRIDAAHEDHIGLVTESVSVPEPSAVADRVLVDAQSDHLGARREPKALRHELELFRREAQQSVGRAHELVEHPQFHHRLLVGRGEQDGGQPSGGDR